MRGDLLKPSQTIVCPNDYVDDDQESRNAEGRIISISAVNFEDLKLSPLKTQTSLHRIKTLIGCKERMVPFGEEHLIEGSPLSEHKTCFIGTNKY